MAEAELRILELLRPLVFPAALLPRVVRQVRAHILFVHFRLVALGCRAARRLDGIPALLHVDVPGRDAGLAVLEGRVGRQLEPTDVAPPEGLPLGALVHLLLLLLEPAGRLPGVPAAVSGQHHSPDALAADCWSPMSARLVPRGGRQVLSALDWDRFTDSCTTFAGRYLTARCHLRWSVNVGLQDVLRGDLAAGEWPDARRNVASMPRLDGSRTRPLLQLRGHGVACSPRQTSAPPDVAGQAVLAPGGIDQMHGV
eukprot:CAMPEP_0179331016 /NCGR_PEP_ID=MMETSP0797-20121207/63979_1 /TAXON_ID=47934 /ORGANISM="Dinophysis acuminata, Strain DAEP01" /LENGTH=254 /DNA_ID=CAMNT_0021043797 /DNA_START=20 /DNA_END=781 /DNA_ORIENTATION=-